MEGADVRERAAELPREPGVYQFVESPGATDVGSDADDARSNAPDDTVIYVGKAVDIRDRARSIADARRVMRAIRSLRGSAYDRARSRISTAFPT